MNRWIDDICVALQNLGGIAHRSDLLKELRRIRPEPHPKTFDETVQRTIQNHSSDSAGFGGEDLLYTVDGIGSGVWGVRSMLLSTPKASDIEEVSSPMRASTEIYRILRDTPLARKIKRLHKNKCQLCSTAVMLASGETYAEAHHIMPLGRPHNGPDIAENIIVVCPNHHVQLDYGAIPLISSSVRTSHGHQIGAEYIGYHNSHIHGTS
nr:HNH endonuclease [uncultured Undibacterium sp.]